MAKRRKASRAGEASVPPTPSASEREMLDTSVARLAGLNVDQLRLHWRNPCGRGRSRPSSGMAAHARARLPDPGRGIRGFLKPTSPWCWRSWPPMHPVNYGLGSRLGPRKSCPAMPVKPARSRKCKPASKRCCPLALSNRQPASWKTKRSLRRLAVRLLPRSGAPVVRLSAGERVGSQQVEQQRRQIGRVFRRHPFARRNGQVCRSVGGTENERGDLLGVSH